MATDQLIDWSQSYKELQQIAARGYTNITDKEQQLIIKARAAELPVDKQTRKEMPITRGLLDYFPLACMAVANCSYVGNQQHNPGEEMHWAREKSTDQADCVTRHLMERGRRDGDGVRHSAKVAWRALALLQLEIEADGGAI